MIRASGPVFRELHELSGQPCLVLVELRERVWTAMPSARSCSQNYMNWFGQPGPAARSSDTSIRSSARRITRIGLDSRVQCSQNSIFYKLAWTARSSLLRRASGPVLGELYTRVGQPQIQRSQNHMSWFGQPHLVLAELHEVVWMARSSDTSIRSSARRIT